MKVILLQDVAKIGRRFSVTDVPDGYALNRLIPQKLAEPATPQNLKKLERKASTVAAAKEADHDAFVVAKDKLSGMSLTINVDANEIGHMFQALKADMVVAAAAEQGVVIEETQVQFPKPIKEIGTHTVELHGGGEVAVVSVEVVAK